MQMTLADSAVDPIDLVLEAWSTARPALLPIVSEPAVDGDFHEIMAQLTLRLDDSQIPLWDDRTAA